MTAETKITAPSADAKSAFERFAPQSFDTLAPLTAKTRELDSILARLGEVGGQTISSKARQLRHRLANVAPSITMIGQVKAGKTSLVNAMVGWPGLLPADVNPWTSVVTSLHISPTPISRETTAEFRFFEQVEWDRLVAHGGRVGEIAGRAGAETELEKVRSQIAAMQEKSRQRLGRKFELLLGQSHDYSSFDTDLIERYVCLGDDFDQATDVTRANGRFADITKSADLYLHRPGLPLGMTIRDTPGVNDTFMVREQITIRAIRDSRICVVVLSAHQALSTVDMALIRLISNIDARDVVIFVNRIDELSDPANEVPEIRDSIFKTLATQKGPTDVEVIFGSALWANLALDSAGKTISPDTIAALKNWAAVHRGKMPGVDDHKAILWQLSGLPDLFGGIARRVIDGQGKETFDAIAKRTHNLAQELGAGPSRMSAQTSASAAPPRIDHATALAHLDRLHTDLGQRLVQDLDKHTADLDERLRSVHENFLGRASAALIDHLDRFGDQDVWSYDPTGLRVLLRSAYQLFAKRALASGGSIYAEAAAQVTELYRSAGLTQDPSFALVAPDLPQVPPPVMLGQTIALDLQGNWWSRWWRRKRGYAAFADDFYKLIHAETEPIVADLSRDHVAALRDGVAEGFAEFMDDQRAAITGILTEGQIAPPMAADPETATPATRQHVIQGALRSLQAIAA